MNKEKQIKNLDNNLVKILEEVSYSVDEHYCIDFDEITPVFDDKVIKNDTPAELFARYLQEKGYGNVKQTAKEFAEKLKDKIQSCCVSNLDDYAVAEVFDYIDELTKEICNEDNN